MRNFLVTALMASALTATPALAENASTNASSAGEWQGSKLIHMNVYNNQDEKIGDIKELMTNKSGQIERVVIGVGGFLGMGEHDVAVKFDQLKWVNEPAKSASSANNTRSSGTTGAASSSRSDNTNRTYPDHALLNATKDQLKAMPEFKYNK
jgi:sporulation protein YlmC with PRC-barrel domain